MITSLLKYTFNILKRTSIIRAMHRQLDQNVPEVKQLLTDEVLLLCNLFIQKGFEIRIVGGAVRDLLMKKQAKDIDLSTTATPNEMIDIFTGNKIRYIETGLQHGTLTARINKKDFEVTTLRIDVETDGRRAKVEFTHDWRLDALRRDLTFNAMSMDINGILYDYFDGEKDLNDGKVRFVGNVDERIREDYLRILRYFRFYGRIAPNMVNHQDVTLCIIKELSSGLKQIAVERIWVEVSKIITGNYAPHLLKLMYDLNVAENIGLPSYTDERIQEFEKVWTNTRNLNPQPISLLVTLVNTESEAEELCLKWKLSTSDKNLACFIAAYRYKFLNKVTTSPLKFYQDIVVRKSNANNLHIVLEQVQELLNYEGKHKESEEISKWMVPKFPITGGDMKKKGIKPGPDFGKVLCKLKDLWVESYYELTKEQLLNEVDKIYESIKESIT